MCTHPTVVGPWWRRHIQGWIAIKEANGLKHEPNIAHRHHRPVLQPSNVSDPQGVPEDHVCVLDTPVGLTPCGQTCTTGVLVGILPRGKAFLRVIGSDPEIL